LHSAYKRRRSRDSCANKRISLSVSSIISLLQRVRGNLDEFSHSIKEAPKDAAWIVLLMANIASREQRWRS
jgi:hypothetical protein